MMHWPWNRPQILSAWPMIILLLLIAFRLTLFLGDFEIQLSRTTYDAGPVAMGHYMHSPQNFSQDVEMNLSHLQWLPSLLFSLTVALDLFLKVKPEVSGLLFVYLQNILLIISMYAFAYRLSKSRWIALVAATYTLWFTPQFFNLSFYGELLWMPYAGHLALPFFIFSFYFVLDDKWKWALGSLLLGGLIHITLGLQVICILGLFWLLKNFLDQKKFTIKKDLKSQISALVTMALCFAIIPKLFIIGIKPVDPRQGYDLVSGVVHQVPWLAGWDPFLNKVYDAATKLLLATLAIIAFRKSLSSSAKILWISVVVTTLLLSFTNILGFWLHSSLLLQVSGLRSSTFLILCSIPFIACAIYPLEWPSFTKKSTFLYSVLLMVLGVFLANQYSGEYTQWSQKMRIGSWLLGFALLAHIFKPRISFYFFAVVMGVLLSWSFTESQTSLSYFWTSITPSIQVATVFGLLAVVAITAFGLFKKQDTSRSFAMFFIAIAFGLNGLADGAEHGKTTTQGNWLKIYEAQVWARDNTPAGSHFILMDLLSPFQSWRTLTRRGVITQAMPYGNQYFYSQEMIAFTVKLNSFYGSPNPEKYFVFDANNENIVRNKMYEAFQNLDESRIVEFSKLFGGDYLVRKTDQKKLNFPVAFQNDYVTIYKIK
jgi:hypothetical protein